MDTVPATTMDKPCGPDGHHGALLTDTAAARQDAVRTVTLEETRADQEVPRELIRRAGFGPVEEDFTRALGQALSVQEARKAVTERGRALWRRAVDRAQGRAVEGDLPAEDDRPLYWTRLRLARALRTWQPGFALEDEERVRLLACLEGASRGHDSMGSRVKAGTKRVVITGFDPFMLDRSVLGEYGDIRHSNPSGAIALALDGVVLETADGPAWVESAMFPLRWADFAAGIVERALTPHFEPGSKRVGLFMTISQGRPGVFDIEHFNGAWRNFLWDNGNERCPGPVPVPSGVPTVTPQPQWTVTTLPATALHDMSAEPYPVRNHTWVAESDAAGRYQERDDGPTNGSRSWQGGGGDYLSNEIAYRGTLLRDACGLHVPGGHVHTPMLTFAEDNTDPASGRLTDKHLEKQRRDVIGQFRHLLVTALETTARPTRQSS
ncbi:pyroglutamyl peptidase [Streptomyces sp. NPDC016626]|uniref:pyroglutamyl peptidase n=1 Tax=Streptomyces sp. NPDC016626 TaxID=3364968 RepID=UPI0036F996F1